MITATTTKQTVQNIIKEILSGKDRKVILKSSNNEILANISEPTLVSATVKAIIENPKGSTAKALDSVLYNYLTPELKTHGNKATLHNLSDKSGAYVTIKDLKPRVKKAKGE
jgi:hypothetical protein